MCRWSPSWIGVDLTGSAGKPTTVVKNAVAQFGRGPLIRRTQSGAGACKGRRQSAWPTVEPNTRPAGAGPERNCRRRNGLGHRA